MPTTIEILRAGVFADAINRPQGCDGYLAGDGSAVIRGIAVTFMASVDVLRRAAALDCNFIITHEPLFYQDGDLEPLRDDPIYQIKRQMIEEMDLTVWRCHDWMHSRPGDMILAGMADHLGWGNLRSEGDPHIFDLPATTLGGLADFLKARLAIPSLRWMGNADMPVRRVALSPGCPWWKDHRRMLQLPGVDALVCGELREWETCEYVRDGLAAGRGTGLIVLGHCNSEEMGMFHLVAWIGGKAPGVPVHLIPAGDPFQYR